MKYLQCFQYPVGDMKIYQGCNKLYSIGIDSSRVENFGALDGKKSITDVMFYNLKNEEQYKQQLGEVEKYLELSSYGYMGELKQYENRGFA